jgi:metallo-beta-lactamase class B
MNRIAALTLGLAALTAPISARPQDDDPMLRPIAPDYAAQWLKHQAPIRIFGNTYLVGFEGLNVGLIKTDAGLILIDGALPQSVRAVQANIRALGFDPRQIKYILSTEPHYDHSSGIAALARDSGATVLASAWAARSLTAGRANPDDPQAAILEKFPPINPVRAVRDGQQIALGGVVVTAHATPGHTPGSMSWSWRTCEGQRCVTAMFASSFNPIAADGWRFLDHPGQLAAFRQSISRMRAFSCGLLISAHPGQSGGDEKYAKLAAGTRPNPFLDPHSCQGYADRFQRALNERIAKEKAGKA